MQPNSFSKEDQAVDWQVITGPNSNTKAFSVMSKLSRLALVLLLTLPLAFGPEAGM